MNTTSDYCASVPIVTCSCRVVWTTKHHIIRVSRQLICMRYKYTFIIHRVLVRYTNIHTKSHNDHTLGHRGDMLSHCIIVYVINRWSRVQMHHITHIQFSPNLQCYNYNTCIWYNHKQIRLYMYTHHTPKSYEEPDVTLHHRPRNQQVTTCMRVQ